MSIKVLVADDHKVVREGLRTLIEKQPGMEVIAEAENGRMALKLIKKLSPDIAIMDIAMPDLNGIEATRQIVAEAPGTKVIALSMHSDRQFVTRMMSAGASGYLLKDCAFEEVARAIRSVMARQIYLSPKIVSIVVKAFLRRSEPSDSMLSVISPREREVLQLIAEGKTTKQIALRLHISAKTVDTHRRNIMDKLDIHSIAELTKYAIREGLTFLET